MNRSVQQKLQALGITRVVTLDFETFYDASYSLSKMPTQQYLLDPLFEIILAGICVDDGEPEWHEGMHAVSKLVSMDLSREGTLVVAHNAHFDGGILEYCLGIRPWMYCCTMMGARPYLISKTANGSMALSNLASLVDVGAKGTAVVHALGKNLAYFRAFPRELVAYGEYCMQDVRICRALAWRILEALPADELRLLDLTVKKFTRPRIRLDTELLRYELKRVQDLKEEVLRSSGVSDPGELRSDAKFADLLRQEGVDPPKKVSPKTQRETYAFAKTDSGLQDLLSHPSERVQALAEARIQHKSSIGETRAGRLLELSELDSLLGVPLIYFGARTGRFSGKDFNIQNLTRGGNLRKALTAPPGTVMVAADLSQIEVRVCAFLAQEKRLLQLFREGADIYVDFATEVYGKPAEDVTKEERRICKSAVLGLQFGMSAPTFEKYLQSNGVTGVNADDVQRLVNLYRRTYNRIPQLWSEAGHWLNVIASMSGMRVYRCGPLTVGPSFVGLPNGMSIQYANACFERTTRTVSYGPEGRRKYIYPAKLVENGVQALARIVMTRAELRLAKYGIRAAFSVHDELVFVVPKSHAMKLVRVLERVFPARVPWMPGLAIECEVKVGSSYGTLMEERSAWPKILD